MSVALLCMDIQVFNRRQAGSRSLRSILFASLQEGSKGHQANCVRQAAPHHWMESKIWLRQRQSFTTLERAQPAGQSRGLLGVRWLGKPSGLPRRLPGLWVVHG